MMQGRAGRQKMTRALFMAMGVLIVMLIVVLIFIVTGVGSVDHQTASLVENGKFSKGVTITGVDVSGLKYDEAAALDDINANVQQAVLDFEYTFSVQDKKYTYTAADLGLSADMDTMLKNALKWGNVGGSAGEEKEEAEENGKNFDIVFKADAGIITAFLKQHKPEYDVLPKNATIKLNRDSGAATPVEFVSEENGVDVVVSKLGALIAAKINNQDYSEIEAPVLTIAPTMDISTLKEHFDTTKPMGTFTSSFASGHLKDKKRVNNIKIMGGFVNGTVIEPGVTWSINAAAGKRNDKTAKTVGWTMAPGLLDGRTTDQYGGGVCQISSTTYNAVIRAELDAVERKPHSWPSDYIKPTGMDATISSDGPDLKILNPYLYPVLLICIIDEKEKTATVSVYGPPMDYTVDFTTKQVEHSAPGPTEYIYNQTQTPDQVPIPANESVDWITPKIYQVWEVYKHKYDKDGNEIGHGERFEDYPKTTYKAFTGVTYCNYPESGPVTSP